MTDRFYYLLGKRISDDASMVELEELENLIQSNAQYKQEAETLLQFWQSGHPFYPSSSEAFERHVARLRAAGHEYFSNTGLPDWQSDADVPVATNGNPKRWKIWLAAAAVLAIGIFIWSVLYQNHHANSLGFAQRQVMNEVQTRSGSRSKVVLPDGTQVWVNASSHLTYDQNFGKAHRIVKLNGEAYFEVEKNENLPFVIHTRHMDVTVTGTKFNLRAYDDETRCETALVEGSVQVQVHAGEGKIFQLKPNDKLVVEMPDGLLEGNPSKNSVNTNRSAAILADLAPRILMQQLAYQPEDSLLVETAWLYSTLAFADETFAEVARKMEKWYGVEIMFESKTLEALKLTGKFTNETLQEALEALQFTAQFRFRRNENRIIIYK